VVQIKSRACSLHTYIAAPLEVYKLVSQDIGALATAISKSTITHCTRVCVCADPFTFLRRDICFKLSPQYSLLSRVMHAQNIAGGDNNIDTIVMYVIPKKNISAISFSS
jgi:hypothetical protein